MSIKPALSAEEWAYIQETDARGDNSWENGWAEQMGRHEAAARALHNQPFGFTREDVQYLR